MKQSVLVNSITGTALYITNVLVTFFFSPFLLKSIGDSNYGIWEIVVSIVGYMGLLDLGIGPAVVRFVSIAYAKQDKQELGHVTYSSLMFFTIIGLLGSLILCLISQYPNLFIDSNSVFFKHWNILLLIFSANVAIQFPMTVFTAVLMGGQRHYLLNTTRIFLSIIKAVLAYLFISYSKYSPLLLLAYIEVASNCIQFTVFSLSVILNSYIPSFSSSFISLSTIKKLFVHGGKSLIYMLTSRLQGQAFPLIIGSIIGPSHIVYFIMPRRLVDYARGLSLTIGFPLTPYFATFIGTEDVDALKGKWLKTSLILNIFTFGMAVILFFLGVHFIRLWLGEQYAARGSLLLYCMTIGLIIDSISVNCNNVLSSANCHGKPALIAFIVALISVIIAIAIAPMHGILGVTIVGTVGTILSSSYLIITACSFARISIIDYLALCVLPIFKSITIFILSTMLLTYFIGVSSFLDIFMIAAFSFCIYFTSVILDLVGINNTKYFICNILHRER